MSLNFLLSYPFLLWNKKTAQISKVKWQQPQVQILLWSLQTQLAPAHHKFPWCSDCMSCVHRAPFKGGPCYRRLFVSFSAGKLVEDYPILRMYQQCLLYSRELVAVHYELEEPAGACLVPHLQTSAIPSLVN